MRYGRTLIFIAVLTGLLLFLAWYMMETMRNGGTPPDLFHDILRWLKKIWDVLSPILDPIVGFLKKIGQSLMSIAAPLIDHIRELIEEKINEIIGGMV